MKESLCVRSSTRQQHNPTAVNQANDQWWSHEHCLLLLSRLLFLTHSPQIKEEEQFQPHIQENGSTPPPPPLKEDPFFWFLTQFKFFCLNLHLTPVSSSFRHAGVLCNIFISRVKTFRRQRYTKVRLTEQLPVSYKCRPEGQLHGSQPSTGGALTLQPPSMSMGQIIRHSLQELSSTSSDILNSFLSFHVLVPRMSFFLIAEQMVGWKSRLWATHPPSALLCRKIHTCDTQLLHLTDSK